jgi:hypothetical protein
MNTCVPVMVSHGVPRWRGVCRWLDRNSFTGTLPTELGNMEALNDLWLTQNSFTGPLPSELGTLTAVSRLRLNQNSFTGTLPTELGNMEALQLLCVRLTHPPPWSRPPSPGYGLWE